VLWPHVDDHRVLAGFFEHGFGRGDECLAHGLVYSLLWWLGSGGQKNRPPCGRAVSLKIRLI
jgi:hypothetical protein